MMTFQTMLQMPFEEAVEKVRSAVQAEGFGVLTTIDIQRTLREKIGEEMRPYRILGVCNPPLAHKALAADPDIGVLLPCNIVVREEQNGEIAVVFQDPDMFAQMTRSEAIREVAHDAKERLERVQKALR